jgi:hypothetical protein
MTAPSPRSTIGWSVCWWMSVMTPTVRITPGGVLDEWDLLTRCVVDGKAAGAGPDERASNVHQHR